MPTSLRVLLVEDNETDAALVLRSLRGGDFELAAHERVDSVEALREALEKMVWDIVISDYHLPSLQASDALKLVRERWPELPFIVVSGSIGEETAVAALKAGANDYVMKDRLQRLASAVRREIGDAEARRERRLLEEQLLQAQKMESIGRLAGGVAHDMNNVLTVILGSTDILLKELKDESLRQEASEIHAASQRAIALIQQLLAFSRRQVMKPQTLDLNVLITDLKKMLQRLVGETIELRLDMADRIGSIRADAGKLEQVLLNLVVNAGHAMPTGGPLTIKTRNVHVDAMSAFAKSGIAPGRYVVLSVIDTGHGMDEHTRAQLFEPFFTTKGPGKGTGLGLATVHGIVKQSGGDIMVDSELGKGSTFTIFLPQVDASPEPTHELAKAVTVQGGQETILVVEDEPVVRAIARRALTRHGYRILEATNGVDALKVIEQHGEVDLILTDVVMPEMGGPELRQRLMQTHPHLKVLFMSGYSEDAIAAHGKFDASSELIQKPFSIDVLARKVRETLDRK